MARKNVVLGLIGVLVLFAVTLTFTEAQLLGGVTKLSGTDLKEAVQILKDSLATLAAGEGPSYKVSKVSWATSQVVSGTLYGYGVNLKAANKKVKKCTVKIWSQPWLENGTQITITCPGEKEVVRKID